ncbi:MAG: thioredoxin-disulfide reductase [SAR324 cluster bacterium]|nr:thioredoxin-disulfide reductase [SAR324 cluster bacterium]
MPNQSKQHHKVLILGSGPAGLTAAIYAARSNLQPALISGPEPGGQLTITTEVENFPGFPEGIQGPEIMKLFRIQAERFGTQFYTGEALIVNLSSRPFQLKTDSVEVTCDTLIVATGASARWIGLDSETRFQNRGVSACATCDGFFFRGHEVAVVGGGDTAMEEALYLANLCKKVYVIHRRDELRASQIMQERAFQHESITFIWNSVVEEVLGNDQQGMTSLKVKNIQTNEIKDYPLTGLFVAIGHVPNTKAFADQLTLDENGYIVVKPGTTYTSVEGVFACGDVQDRVYRQAITAAGTGCMAAIDAERWLAEHTS